MARTRRMAILATLATAVVTAGCSGSDAPQPSPAPEPGLVDVSEGIHRFDVEDRCGDRDATGIAMLDPDTGEVIWHQLTDWSSTMVDDPERDALYIAHASGAELPSIVSYDRTSGEPRWQRFFDADRVQGVGIDGDLLIVDQRGRDRSVAAVDACDGSIVWQSPEVPEGDRNGRFRIVDSQVDNGNWAVDLATGSPTDLQPVEPAPEVIETDDGLAVVVGSWRSDPLPAAGRAQVSGVFDDIVAVSLWQPRQVVGVDLSTGAVRWQRADAQRPRWTPSTLVVKEPSGSGGPQTLVALDPTDGEPIWTLEGADRVLMGDTVVFTFSPDDRLRTVDLATGEVRHDVEMAPLSAGERLSTVGDHLVMHRLDGARAIERIDPATGSPAWSRSFDDPPRLWHETAAGWVVQISDRLTCNPEGFD